MDERAKAELDDMTRHCRKGFSGLQPTNHPIDSNVNVVLPIVLPTRPSPSSAPLKKPSLHPHKQHKHPQI
jgi:hypothetical protein